MPYRGALEVVQREVFGLREAVKEASRRFGYAHRAVLPDRGAPVDKMHDDVMPVMEGEIVTLEEGTRVVARLQDVYAAYEEAIAKSRPLLVAPEFQAQFFYEEVPLRLHETNLHALFTSVPRALGAFQLRAQGNFEGILRNDVRVGSLYFDERFWIQGDVAAATAALCVATQDALLSLINLGPGLVFGGGLVTLTCKPGRGQPVPDAAVAALVHMRRALIS